LQSHFNGGQVAAQFIVQVFRNALLLLLLRKEYFLCCVYFLFL
jgi:hypothetical protein